MSPRPEQTFLLVTGSTALGLLALGFILRHFDRMNRGARQ